MTDLKDLYVTRSLLEAQAELRKASDPKWHTELFVRPASSHYPDAGPLYVVRTRRSTVEEQKERLAAERIAMGRALAKKRAA